jgi:hypothetical protein
MRVRVILASLMAVLLLSLSYVSSTCAISCDLMEMTQSHLKGARTSAPSAMPDCSMNEDQGVQEAASITMQSPACNHHVCVEQPVVLKNLTEIATHLIPVSNTTMQVATPTGTNASKRFRASETPPLRSPSLIALQTTLRV